MVARYRRGQPLTNRAATVLAQLADYLHLRHLPDGSAEVYGRIPADLVDALLTEIDKGGDAA